MATVEVVAGVAVALGVAVAAAPQMALRVVENQFAIAIMGALKMFTELGSALMEDERSAIFLSGPLKFVIVHDCVKSSKSACGF